VGTDPAAARSWWSRPASTKSFLMVMSAGSLASVLALVVGVRPLFESARLRHLHTAALDRAEELSRSRGTLPRAEITVRVVTADDENQQRVVAPERPERLAVGERIRVGVQPGTHRFLFAISIDERGTVTPLYPEVGISMPLPRGGGMQYLPDTLELTGKGTERLVVLLTDEPLEIDGVRHAVALAFAKVGVVGVGGNLSQLFALPTLAPGGEQFHRVFIIP
jgi:hypothetical protein